MRFLGTARFDSTQRRSSDSNDDEDQNQNTIDDETDRLRERALDDSTRKRTASAKTDSTESVRRVPTRRALVNAPSHSAAQRQLADDDNDEK